MNLVFASHNSHKTNEIRSIFRDTNLEINVLSLSEIGILEDIEETGQTLEENAFIKTQFVYNKLRVDCFSDDTGLEISSLEGLPGVNTARFAGDAKDNKANIAKVLSLLNGVADRRAKFRTIISLNYCGDYHIFEGIIEGNIATTIRGGNGFGYDPIFIPFGYSKSFAEMSDNIKNRLSHRYLAIQALINFLKIKNK